MSNRSGLGYSTVVGSITTKQKTIFVKATPTTTNQPVSGKNIIPPVLEGKVTGLFQSVTFVIGLIIFVLNVISIKNFSG